LKKKEQKERWEVFVVGRIGVHSSACKSYKAEATELTNLTNSSSLVFIVSTPFQNSGTF
jgi:hypothetical protein